MKAFLVTAGSVFGLVVVVHLYRITIEPHLIHEPWFWLITALSAGLSLWAWRLVWPSRA
jgi:hypothetical protein